MLYLKKCNALYAFKIVIYGMKPTSIEVEWVGSRDKRVVEKIIYKWKLLFSFKFSKGDFCKYS